jgi:biliverdin reductase
MHPIKVGLVGTGYAAKVRAESLQADPRAQLVAVAGHWIETTRAFSGAYGAEALDTWSALIDRADIDLIIIATINCDHGVISRAALEAGKHVVVEYPLATKFSEAAALVSLAQAQNRLLHVEHIELLSGIHQAVKAALPAIGTPFYGRYTNLNAQRPAPQKWTYVLQQFGFPLMGAVSRIHRLTDLFGPVAAVTSQARFWYASESLAESTDRFTACLCTAQLRFVSGFVADVVYGKGEAIWQSARTLEVHGQQGGIFINGEQGTLVQPDQTQTLDMGSRRGLFAKDTAMVLDHLITGAPLYVSLEASLYALQVADAARRSAETGATIELAATSI